MGLLFAIISQTVLYMHINLEREAVIKVFNAVISLDGPRIGPVSEIKSKLGAGLSAISLNLKNSLLRCITLTNFFTFLEHSQQKPS